MTIVKSILSKPENESQPANSNLTETWLDPDILTLLGKRVHALPGEE